MPFHYHFPVDPDCPEAAKLLAAEQEGYDDPMTQYYGASDCIADLYASKKRKHIASCERCREYGCANVEVRD
jgi:hypothetical protein